MAGETFGRVEAVGSGAIVCALEVYIWSELASAGRSLFYYHLIPLATGLLLICDGVWPGVPSLSLASSVISAVTTLNIFNTYFVHVVASRHYLQEADAGSVEDLFLPRYVDGFYPWGAVFQVVYSLVALAHCIFRLHVTTHTLLVASAVMR
jgi:hypothetical protein